MFKKLRKFIHHLRHRKEEERRKILNVSIVILAALLILLWAFSFGVTLVSNDDRNISDDFSELEEQIIE